MDKAISAFLLIASVLLCLLGIIGFIVLFGPDMNVFWIILAPIIIAVYQIPAVAVYYLWKKRKRREQAPGPDQIDSQENDSPPSIEP